jgi:peptidoglycan/xylan/chitin deacetylase (PgdA/CDA1 family)
MEIGSHTCSHPDLTKLNYQQQKNEMIRSKKILESLISCKISSFAYPYGRQNNDSIRAVKYSDYQLACTVNPGDFNSEKNPLLVKRITIFATDSAATMARKLAFADNDVGRKKMTGYYYQRVKDKLAGKL